MNNKVMVRKLLVEFNMDNQPVPLKAKERNNVLKQGVLQFYLVLKHTGFNIQVYSLSPQSFPSNIHN